MELNPETGSTPRPGAASLASMAAIGGRRSAELRAERTEVLEKVSAGTMSVLAAGELAAMGAVRAVDLLSAVPGMTEEAARELLAEVRAPETARMRALGCRQRAHVLQTADAVAKGVASDA